MSRRFSRQAGVTLLEVLIAVLVLSIGLLGALKLQVVGVKQNADSRYTVMAAAFAQDALETLRFDLRHDKASWTVIDPTTQAAALSGRPAQWLTALQRDLPDGKATVSCDSSLNKCSVSISWTPPGASQVSANYEMYN